MGQYPFDWESDVLLADGSRVKVRPIRREDGPAHRAFFSRLSPETVRLRFFTAMSELSKKEVERFVDVDYVDRFALVAVADGEIIAVVRYERLAAPVEAEVAVVVEDDYQGRGVGTLLLEHLAAAARQRGVERFVADVLPENRVMQEVFREMGFSVVSRLDGGVVRAEFSIDPTPEARSHIEHREHLAAVRSMQRLLAPRSVAVIGASNQSGSVGRALFGNLLAGGFEGPIYPVNPEAEHVASVRAYPNVLDIPGLVDLAVVAVPAEAVLEVVESCSVKGVKSLVIVSAGFAETGPDGAAAQQEVLNAASRAGMRLVGPNCIGIVNTVVGLNATFSPFKSLPGRVAFSSQSGALGIALLEWSARLGIGVSSFVSMGNKADVSGIDLLEYWEDDPDTDVVLLYLESFGNPRKFSRIARRLSRKKPIVAVKSGRSPSGSRAASSHTAAMASPDVAVDALFRKAGVIRVDTLDQMLDVAQILASQSLPAGPRIAIVGNSGGPGILAADACVVAGLDIAELAPETTAQLAASLGQAASVRNPVDMVASAGPDDYRRTLAAVLDDDNVDMAIVIFTPPLITDPEEISAAILDVASRATKPVVANLLASDASLEVAGTELVPVFRSPEPAAAALGRIVEYAAWRRSEEGVVRHFADIDVDTARAIVRTSLVAHPEGGWLDPQSAVGLLRAFGIPVAEGRVCETADEATLAAADLGYPVVLKAASPDMVHKTDQGGIHLDLSSEAEVLSAFDAMRSRLGHGMGGALVQPMIQGELEVISGVTQEQSFGPLVMFGLGGVATEVLDDRAFTIVPVTDRDAAQLIRSIRASPLLSGFRGTAPLDTAALEELVLRIGRLAELVPELAELDLNPILVSESGVVAVDWQLRLAPSEPTTPDLVRRL